MSPFRQGDQFWMRRAPDMVGSAGGSSLHRIRRPLSVITGREPTPDFEALAGLTDSLAAALALLLVGEVGVEGHRDVANEQPTERRHLEAVPPDFEITLNRILGVPKAKPAPGVTGIESNALPRL